MRRRKMNQALHALAYARTSDLSQSAVAATTTPARLPRRGPRSLCRRTPKYNSADLQKPAQEKNLDAASPCCFYRPDFNSPLPADFCSIAIRQRTARTDSQRSDDELADYENDAHAFRRVRSAAHRLAESQGLG